MNTRIEELNEDLNGIKWAIKFCNYVQYRKKGLKADSQSSLNQFIVDFELQNKADRRKFIDVICNIAFMTDDYSIYLPDNLYKKIVLPEISAWISDDPLNAIPFKWSEDLDNNRKSIELDPNNQVALEKFARRLIGKISMNQHEIKHGYKYDGNPDQDIASIDDFERFIGNLGDALKRNEILQLLVKLRGNAIDYKESKIGKG